MRTMPVAIAPNPDEIDQSYAGALMRINGYATEKELALAIADSLGLSNLNFKKMPMVELLARISGMGLKHFVCCHTMVPLRRGITQRNVSTSHGPEAKRSIMCKTSRRQNSAGAMMCPGCVQAEQAIYGRSFWHREHQIPGFIWCSKHQIPLLACTNEGAYFRSPSEFMSKGECLPIDCDEDFVKSPAYKTYVGVCSALLETTQPFDWKVVGGILAARCRIQKVRRSPASRGWLNSVLTLSGHARKLYPPQWLGSLMPSSVVPGEISPLEDAAWGASVGHATSYAVACAILYASADEAMVAISIENRPEPIRWSSKRWKEYLQGFEDRAKLRNEARAKQVN